MVDFDAGPCLVLAFRSCLSLTAFVFWVLSLPQVWVRARRLSTTTPSSLSTTTSCPTPWQIPSLWQESEKLRGLLISLA
ncbi:hypothetical protein ARMGADRAFT_1014258 [Armillaria gallica]|uniref:Uncharacterized protein n=1 Tax=Armillaria gallica TaxID=47427 RepID=A0A2H3DHP1_ARMGA|nr:hypothetical protein ARMGADRAFT_1014258 [Armillaria gallica]